MGNQLIMLYIVMFTHVMYICNVNIEREDAVYTFFLV